MSKAASAQQGPTILALDATAGQYSVALLHGATCWGRAAPLYPGQARDWWSMLDAVWQASGYTPASLDALAFGCGPGAFTSLRIACGLAQGLALAWNKPVLPIDALRTLAEQAARSAPSGVTNLWVAMDVRMGQVCRAMFAGPLAGQEQAGTCLLAPALVTPQQAMTDFDALFKTAPGPVCLAGDALDVYAPMQPWWHHYQAKHACMRPAAAIQPDAHAVARLAAADFLQGQAQDPARVAPWYLRDQVALDLAQQQALRAARTVA